MEDPSIPTAESHSPGALTPESIVAEHWASVFRLLCRLSGNAHDAEELTQEVFLRAIQKLGQFTPGTNMRGWLMRIATNAFLDTQRRKRTSSMDEMEFEPPEEGPTGDSIVAQQDVMRKVNAALLQLPETQRTVFLLRSTEDMPFREIAEMIGTTEATARWHMLQARQQLMKLLDGDL